MVFIFDECHRSQFGEAQKNLKKKFKKFYQFGFTGTPIFPENALGAETTASVFGRELHSYVITDAIRDEKVLKFNGTFKVECVHGEHFKTRAQAKRAIMEYIGYYNTERRHSSLGNLTPAQFERRWRAEKEKSAQL